MALRVRFWVIFPPALRVFLVGVRCFSFNLCAAFFGNSNSGVCVCVCVSVRLILCLFRLTGVPFFSFDRLLCICFLAVCLRRHSLSVVHLLPGYVSAASCMMIAGQTLYTVMLTVFRSPRVDVTRAVLNQGKRFLAVMALKQGTNFR